jgi:hypothetical protein
LPWACPPFFLLGYWDEWYESDRDTSPPTSKVEGGGEGREGRAPRGSHLREAPPIAPAPPPSGEPQGPGPAHSAGPTQSEESSGPRWGLGSALKPLPLRGGQRCLFPKRSSPPPLEGSLPLSSSRGFGREEEKCAASASFFLADNLCLRAEQMAGNLAITVCGNGTRSSTWKPKESLPQSHVVLCPFSLFCLPSTPIPAPPSPTYHVGFQHSWRGDLFAAAGAGRGGGGSLFILIPQGVRHRFLLKQTSRALLLTGSSSLTFIFLAAIITISILSLEIVGLSPNLYTPCFFRFTAIMTISIPSQEIVGLSPNLLPTQVFHCVPPKYLGSRSQFPEVNLGLQGQPKSEELEYLCGQQVESREKALWSSVHTEEW